MRCFSGAFGPVAYFLENSVKCEMRQDRILLRKWKKKNGKQAQGTGKYPGHPNAALFFNYCGMRKPVFVLLLPKPTSVMRGLSDSRTIGAGEKSIIFLSVS